MDNIELDDEYSETAVEKVRTCGGGWEITLADGWSFFVGEDGGVEPKVGQTARFYGAGSFKRKRGLTLDGAVVFYRNAQDDAEYRDIELYGADATEWLRRWDAGNSVWTIEMGGLGPGYEQAIHVTCAEVLRHLLDKQYDFTLWDDPEVWKIDRDAIEAMGFANERIKSMGLSGAQWGAACNVALQLYKRGPRAVMADENVKDRHIQVSRTFPAEVA